MILRCCFCSVEGEGSAELLESRGWASKRVKKNGRERVTAACPVHVELIEREVGR